MICEGCASSRPARSSGICPCRNRELQAPVFLHAQARADLVGGDHARPGLDQCSLGEAGARLDGKKVAALIALEDLGADDGVL